MVRVADLFTFNFEAVCQNTEALMEQPGIEELFSIRGITSWAEVAHLGKNNIDRIVSIVRREEQNLAERIKRMAKHRILLEGKSGQDFQEMAKRYENPKDMKVGFFQDSHCKEEEPIDLKSQGRKRGSTNFNICGWCDYASGGTERYSYVITSWCSLRRNFSGECKFNSPCTLHFTDKQFICRLVDDIKTEIEDLKVKREVVRVGIKTLERLKEGLIEKPYLITLRPHDLFNVGDEVAIYLGGFDNNIIDEKWVRARVIDGYRHHDNCISFKTDFPVISGDRVGGAGMSRPECMLIGEFEYLRHAKENDKEFFRIWCKNLDDELGRLDMQVFIKDLLAGNFVTPPGDEISVKS